MGFDDLKQHITELKILSNDVTEYALKLYEIFMLAPECFCDSIERYEREILLLHRLSDLFVEEKIKLALDEYSNICLRHLKQCIESLKYKKGIKEILCHIDVLYYLNEELREK